MPKPNLKTAFDSATSETATSTANWHQTFLAMLPKIQKHASYMFRELKGDHREEAIQDAICNACLAFARLVDQGRAEAATWSSLARYAVAQVRDGRRVGTSLNIKDVCSQHCQQRKGIAVTNLSRWDDQNEEWKEMIVEDPHSTPADVAAFRIDFREWLKTLNPRNRKVVLKLSEGESPQVVARLFKISAARVSQLRRELSEAWYEFQGEWKGLVADGMV
jgi:DNA-directed RNA polymerase specialized sigma24 family protein